MGAEPAPAGETVASQRDQWKAHAQAAWQVNAELREMLSRAIGNNTWRDGDLEAARALLERTKRP